MKALLAITFIFFSFTATAADKFIPDPENQMLAKDVMSVWVAWIKDKGEKFDLNINMRNENPDKAYIVFLSDMGCKRGKVRGQLKHTFFNTGERTIDFKPNEAKDFNLVCKTSGGTRGEFSIEISRIYDNPSMDGKTVGKVVAKGLSWTQSDRKE